MLDQFVQIDGQIALLTDHGLVVVDQDVDRRAQVVHDGDDVARGLVRVRE